jgi:hypothetical protein
MDNTETAVVDAALRASLAECGLAPSQIEDAVHKAITAIRLKSATDIDIQPIIELSLDCYFTDFIEAPYWKQGTMSKDSLTTEDEEFPFVSDDNNAYKYYRLRNSILYGHSGTSMSLPDGLTMKVFLREGGCDMYDTADGAPPGLWAFDYKDPGPKDIVAYQIVTVSEGYCYGVGEP